MKNFTVKDYTGKCGSCQHLNTNPTKAQKAEANTEAGRLKGTYWKAGVCVKLGLWCSLISKRCGGGQWEQKEVSAKDYPKLP